MNGDGAGGGSWEAGDGRRHANTHHWLLNEALPSILRREGGGRSRGVEERTEVEVAAREAVAAGAAAVDDGVGVRVLGAGLGVGE